MSNDAHGLLSALRLVLGVAAAVLLFKAGHDMRTLSSQAGDTVAEFFDHALGLMCYGFALASLMIAIPTTFTQKTRDPEAPAEFALDAGDDEGASV